MTTAVAEAQRAPRRRKKGVCQVAPPILNGNFENVSSLVESFLDINPDFLGNYVLSKIDPLTLEKWTLLSGGPFHRKSVSAFKKTARSISGGNPPTFSRIRKYSHDILKSISANNEVGGDALSGTSGTLVKFFQEPNNDSLEGITRNLYRTFGCSEIKMRLTNKEDRVGYRIELNENGFYKSRVFETDGEENLSASRSRKVSRDPSTGQMFGFINISTMNGILKLKCQKNFFSSLDECKFSYILNVLKTLLGLILQNELNNGYESKDPYNEDHSVALADPIPNSSTLGLSSFDFNYLSLDKTNQFRSVISMMNDLGLVRRFRMDLTDLSKWIASVFKNYRNEIVPYHNWYHAFNVAQTMYLMLIKTNWNRALLNDVEVLALMIACLCHDLDHPGTNNSFQQKTNTPLSTLYKSSILENYHAERTLCLLNDPENYLLKNLTKDEYEDCVDLITQRILDTDLALYFRDAPRIKKASLCGKDHLPEHKSLVMSALMTAADLNIASKPWEVYSSVSCLLAEEFWTQGDLEKSMGLEPEPLMDRDLKHLFPSMQIEFLDKVCIPIMDCVSRFHSELTPLADKARNNRLEWVARLDNEDREESLEEKADLVGKDLK